MWIQVIDCGLITSEDILINRQVPEWLHLSFPTLPHSAATTLINSTGHSTTGQRAPGWPAGEWDPWALSVVSLAAQEVSEESITGHRLMADD